MGQESHRFQDPGDGMDLLLDPDAGPQAGHVVLLPAVDGMPPFFTQVARLGTNDDC